MGADALQGDDGRWRWVGAEKNPKGFRLDAGIVSFESKAEALDDLAAHQVASLDATGRLVLPKEHIQRLIRAAAQPCEACEATYFGRVYWHERDEMGCNWSVSTIQGSNWSACFDALQPTAIQLRQAYSIPDEG